MNLGSGQTFVIHGAVAATNALTLTLPVPPTGYATVIDSLVWSYVGTTQTSQPVLVRVAGAGATRWQIDVTSGVAGFGQLQIPFPGGAKFQATEALEVFGAAMANCAQKGSCVGHLEIADRTTP